MIDPDNRYILVRGTVDGCYNCDGVFDMPVALKIDILDSVKDLVNLMHDILEMPRNSDNNYPLNLYTLEECGEIVYQSEVKLKAGCLSGLQEISFKIGSLKYTLKRGQRKNEMG